MRWSILVAVLFLFASCNSSSSPSELGSSYQKLRGNTMGTTYSVIIGRKTKGIQKKIDKLLVDINAELSTYIPSSTISQINVAKEKFAIQDTKDYINQNVHFKKVFSAAKEIHALTKGAFEPTVMPLVNYWGFGPNKKKPEDVDSISIQNLVQKIGFDKVKKEVVAKDQKLYISKPSQEVAIDFSAIAKGYAVDEIAFLLEQNAIGNYLVEIGGEVKARGVNQQGKLWSIALNTPKKEAALNDAFQILHLENIAVASSGNYRNYFELDGKIYSHTLNPKTGYPERSNLLSATIFSDDCMTADAVATACMVGGLEKAKTFLEQGKNIEGYFIYSDEQGALKEYASVGARKYLNEK